MFGLVKSRLFEGATHGDEAAGFTVEVPGFAPEATGFGIGVQGGNEVRVRLFGGEFAGTCFFRLGLDGEAVQGGGLADPVEGDGRAALTGLVRVGWGDPDGWVRTLEIEGFEAIFATVDAESGGRRWGEGEVDFELTCGEVGHGAIGKVEDADFECGSCEGDGSGDGLTGFEGDGSTEGAG